MSGKNNADFMLKVMNEQIRQNVDLLNDPDADPQSKLNLILGAKEVMKNFMDVHYSQLSQHKKAKITEDMAVADSYQEKLISYSVNKYKNDQGLITSKGLKKMKKTIEQVQKSKFSSLSNQNSTGPFKSARLAKEQFSSKTPDKITERLVKVSTPTYDTKNTNSFSSNNYMVNNNIKTLNMNKCRNYVNMPEQNLVKFALEEMLQDDLNDENKNQFDFSQSYSTNVRRQHQEFEFYSPNFYEDDLIRRKEQKYQKEQLEKSPAFNNYDTFRVEDEDKKKKKKKKKVSKPIDDEASFLRQTQSSQYRKDPQNEFQDENFIRSISKKIVQESNQSQLTQVVSKLLMQSSNGQLKPIRNGKLDLATFLQNPTLFSKAQEISRAKKKLSPEKRSQTPNLKNSPSKNNRTRSLNKSTNDLISSTNDINKSSKNKQKNSAKELNKSKDSNKSSPKKTQKSQRPQTQNQGINTINILGSKNLNISKDQKSQHQNIKQSIILKEDQVLIKNVIIQKENNQKSSSRKKLANSNKELKIQDQVPKKHESKVESKSISKVELDSSSKVDTKISIKVESKKQELKTTAKVESKNQIKIEQKSSSKKVEPKVQAVKNEIKPKVSSKNPQHEVDAKELQQFISNKIYEVEEKNKSISPKTLQQFQSNQIQKNAFKNKQFQNNQMTTFHPENFDELQRKEIVAQKTISSPLKSSQYDIQSNYQISPQQLNEESPMKTLISPEQQSPIQSNE